MRRKHWLIILVTLLALIVLPTGTPEDIPTTWLIIGLVGFKAYVLLAIIVLIVYLIVTKQFLAVGNHG